MKWDWGIRGYEGEGVKKRCEEKKVTFTAESVVTKSSGITSVPLYQVTLAAGRAP
ncbi:hypothetical protein Phum_PHUM109520 [Pediculus humanus corporis]|uniref:Uncharacterized protein n=1 Tax=Pediculus humanus subsp. corporis TaxID=121224 RepID=E0VDB9_PEDHC|nr:uncharacterized protein Phum_PHUM109520 [Pediculus humanus corporis]EEB11375.1 hypothetical protein Phum_PHUM109520 [Pediculus humanus corporis]